jgi:hypothetical protein
MGDYIEKQRKYICSTSTTSWLGRLGSMFKSNWINVETITVVVIVQKVGQKLPLGKLEAELK